LRRDAIIVVMHDIPGNWYAIIEESGSSGQYAYFKVTHTFDLGPDRETAVQAAQQLTATHKPAHPWSEQARQIFEHGVDAWIVIVQGAMHKHHFRVSLARLVATH